MDSGQMYCVYRNRAAAAYSSLYFFIFLSNFQILKIFVTLFSGTVRPRRLKLGTHVDHGRMYRVYLYRATVAYSFLYFFIFLSLQFSNINIFVTLFSGTVRPRRLKLDTHLTMDGCTMYTRIRQLLLIYPFIFSSPELKAHKVSL